MTDYIVLSLIYDYHNFFWKQFIMESFSLMIYDIKHANKHDDKTLSVNLQ